jgi:L-ascorbate metabolism protein UlaG (beta-lactamase superfamily)
MMQDGDAAAVPAGERTYHVPPTKTMMTSRSIGSKVFQMIHHDSPVKNSGWPCSGPEGEAPA